MLALKHSARGTFFAGKVTTDVPSYHDFHTLQIAFQHVWTEIFDGQLTSLGRDLYGEYVKLKDFSASIHTFEEAYFILKGEVEATVDGKTYLAKPGDIVWTDVGCVHGLANVGTVPVTWLETFAPQPPSNCVRRQGVTA